MTINDWNNTLSDLPDNRRVKFVNTDGESCRAWAGEIRGVLEGEVEFTFVVPDSSESEEEDSFKMNRDGFLAARSIA